MTEVNNAATPAASVSPSAFRRLLDQSGFNTLKRQLRHNASSIYIFSLLLVLGMILLAPSIFINVPAGHSGVLWLRFFGGTVTDRTFGEGVHAIFPWDEMYIYDARLQNNVRTYDTISSNGLTMQVEVAVRYRVNKDSLGLLHALVGPDYPEILVYPEIGSHVRELISRYTPEQLYSDARGFIQAELLERMVRQLGSSLVNQSFRGKLVTVEDVLIRSVKLPEKVSEAIERKAEQYQAMLEYDFRIAREEKERERKKIEAEGIRTFQDIVARTITPEYLRLRGIEATIALSTSPNGKIIIIGGGKDGLPVILNTADTSPPSPLRADAAPAPTREASPTTETKSFNARSSDIPPPNAALPVTDVNRRSRPSVWSSPVPTEFVPAPPAAVSSGDGKAPSKESSDGKPAAPPARKPTRE
ncbi:prohibitin family protein [Magnetospirillum fulvum]|uniref:Regulator of protease activity HflC, stomatin/prohibitin superfamily n=1 Tax=Magnetospirillum fulvum TaxID=1082 RepID=A0A1H6HSD4_MAGFU|nr:prohibitin family protein [Magnetospirillum fulvum]SEH37964.1 Regulator of protease activity HflC, stomatin/prohibitin superfamily [Magnetospirillum fulvum]